MTLTEKQRRQAAGELAVMCLRHLSMMDGLVDCGLIYGEIQRDLVEFFGGPVAVALVREASDLVKEHAQETGQWSQEGGAIVQDDFKSWLKERGFGE